MIHVLQTIERNEVQIQLKQAEIEQAIKQYISKQGISLTSKAVEITFTAKRNDAGLMADVTIEDLGSVTDGDVPEREVAKPALSVVTAPIATADTPLPILEVSEPAAPKAATSSLFA